MKMKKIFFIMAIMLMTGISFPQSAGDVMFTEIGNGGTKKALYHGGDYVELTILKDSTCLGGCYLTDYSSPTSLAGEKQGRVLLRNTQASVFSKPLAKGAIILVCLESKSMSYGGKTVEELLNNSKTPNRIVVFPYEDTVSFVADSGHIGLTGKDNIALVKGWAKNAALDVVSWGRNIKWQGCPVVELPQEILDNGNIVSLKKNTPYDKHTLPENWVGSSDEKDATPGFENIAK
jgi:hypothetical protein